MTRIWLIHLPRTDRITALYCLFVLSISLTVINRSLDQNCFLLTGDVIYAHPNKNFDCVLNPFTRMSGSYEFGLALRDALFGISLVVAAATMTLTDQSRRLIMRITVLTVVVFYFAYWRSTLPYLEAALAMSLQNPFVILEKTWLGPGIGRGAVPALIVNIILASASRVDAIKDLFTRV